MANYRFNKATHCIFDLDGLLLDTETLYTEAIQRILEPFGKTYTFDVKLKCMGFDAKTMGEFMVANYELPMTPEEYMEEQDKNTKVLMGDCKLMPGVERLIRHLNAYHIPMAIATGSSKSSYEFKVQPHRDLFKLFHHVVCASTDPDVMHGKPAPDVFLTAAARFPCKPAPQCCLVFEDAPNGVVAAVSAGMQVVMVPDPRVPCEISASATQRLATMYCFKPQDFGIPSFRNNWMNNPRLFCANKKSPYKPVTHCIFDMDGTILDNGTIYSQVMEKILEPYGKKFTLKDKLTIMGAQPKPLSEYMVKRFELPITPQQYLEKQYVMVAELSTNIALMPGVEKLMCHLKAHKVPMALATSSSKETYDVKIKPHKALWTCFHHTVVGTIDPDVKEGKPAPDIFLVAASRFPDKPKPECCLVFEDAPLGIQAAAAAGMQVIMTPIPNLPCEYSKEATLRLKSCEEFVPEEFGLPPYDCTS